MNQDLSDASVTLAAGNPYSPARQAVFLDEVRTTIEKSAWEDLEALCLRRLEAAPDSAEAWFVRAIAAFLREEHGQAITFAHSAFDADPAVEEYADLLARCYAYSGNLPESVFHAKLAGTLQSRPEIAQLIPPNFPKFGDLFMRSTPRPLFERARAKLAERDWITAEELFSQHLSTDPTQADSQIGLAIALANQGKYYAAAQGLRAAMHMHPRHPAIAGELASVLFGLGQFSQGRALYGWASRLAPQDAGLQAQELLALPFDPDCRGAEIAARVQNWAQRFARPAGAINAAAPKPVLRVGYLLGYMGFNPQAQALSEILSYHNPRRFRAIGFGVGTMGELANLTFQKAFAEWQNIRDCDPLTLARMLSSNNLDILVDLMGFQDPDALKVIGSCNVPCLVSWSDGGLYGTGTERVRYLLTDRVLDPEGSRPSFREQPLYLEQGSLMVGLPTHNLPVPPAQPVPSFIADVSFKGLNVDVVATWARILQNIESIGNWRLLLCDHDFRCQENVARLLELFGNFGVAHRIDVLAPGARNMMLAQGSVYLAGFPMTGLESVMDALWAGLPVICLNGADRHGRQAASLLRHTGLPDRLIAESPEDYIDLALDWAYENDRRDAFRATVRERLRNAPAFNGRQRAADLERALEQAWQEMCQHS